MRRGASLDSSRFSHKAIAWLLLHTLVGVPVLLRLTDWLGET